MDKFLLDILACPTCKGNLIYRKKQQELVCNVDKQAFPIEDGIPVMLEEEARAMTSEEVDNL